VQKLTSSGGKRIGDLVGEELAVSAELTAAYRLSEKLRPD